MLRFIVRRVLQMLPLLLLISIVSFVLINLPPGDYLTIKISELQARGDASAELILEQYRSRFGLDLPMWQQYWIWISHFVTGDFGRSFEYERDVGQLIGERFGFSIMLSLSTMLFAWLVAIPAGIYAATHQYRLGDNIVSLIAFIGLAVPNFLLALTLMYVSVTVMGWSVGGLFSPDYIGAPWSFDKFVDLLKHLWVPVVIIGTAGTAGLMRMMRGNLLDVLRQQYVLTARAKGVPEGKVIYKHALRVAINPLISVAGTMFPAVIAGEVITSVILNLPTIGPLFLRALQVQDMYLAGAILMFMSLFLMLGNLLADIGLALADPRIRIQ